MNRAKEQLDEALRLASEGHSDQALARLDALLQQATVERDARWIQLIAVNAAVVTSDPARAAEYYEMALPYRESDPYIHLALGDSYREQGESSIASEYYERGVDLAKADGDESLVEVLRKKIASI